MKITLGFALIMTGLVVVGCGKQSSTSTPPAQAAKATSAPPVAVVAAVSDPAPVSSHGLTLYKAQPLGSKIIIEGDSTAHKWTMEGTIIGGSMELDPAIIEAAQTTNSGLKSGRVSAKAQASIPVRSLKSGHDIMDRLYKEALKEPNFPRIEYRLTEMKLKDGHVAGKPLEFDTQGQLSFAGVTNTVSMPVKMESTDKSKIKIVGNCPLKMTAFGIKPPAPVITGGMMKCADDVNIVFAWTLAIPATTTAGK